MSPGRILVVRLPCRKVFPTGPLYLLSAIRRAIDVVRRAIALLGGGLVVPVVFFLAIQPHTGREQAAIHAGHIRKGYDPLSVLPWNVLKLIYNPPPLGGIIGRACVRAFADGIDSPGMKVLAEIEREIGGKHVI